MNRFANLNQQQQQAVMAGNGPILVLAGPGSGKTRVLTQRIVYLIEELRVPPRSILAVTFTNKAALEMDKRVKEMLADRAYGVTLGTFHAICARILRREAEKHLPFKSNFVIFDQDDQVNLAKQAIKDLNLDEKRYRPTGVHAAISKAKNDLILPENFPVQTYRDEIVKRVFVRYQDLLIANNALDFDDLLVWTAQLLETNLEVREKYARWYEHVLVDEFQDTNLAQYVLIKHLSSFHHNIFVVGDTDQCFPAGTMIQTPSGPRPIETLQTGQQVIAASGRGSVMPATINHVESRHYDGDLVQVSTRKGYTFKSTPNHIIFARLGIDPDVNYVYLMNKKDLGYRIGIVIGARSDGDTQQLKTGLRVRINQEHADKIWILKVCNDRTEALYWESFFAFQYSIPTTLFHAYSRGLKFNQEHIQRLYESIDTEERAKRLLEDLGLDYRYPHYIPRAKLLRQAVNLRYFGDSRRTTQSPWNAHRVDIWGSDNGLREKLSASGIHMRRGKRNTWRTGFSRLDFDDAHEITKKISEIGGGLEIVTGAFLTQATGPLADRFSLMPASHLHPSMVVAVEQDGEVIEDMIVEVKHVRYKGKIYDLEVDCLHNYISGGIVVHNSIYRWRGADYRNVRRFERDFPDTQVILLEQNYRSVQSILDVAMEVIDRNPHRTRKQLFTERGEGQKVILHPSPDDRVEAAYVVDTIANMVARGQAKPGDFAVMYRTNAQSRLLEEAFLHASLPYKLVGAQRFYGRREIKDIIAYLRLVHNPDDEFSLSRILGVPPRGIGDKTYQLLRQQAQRQKLSTGRLLLEFAAGKLPQLKEVFPGRTGTSLSNFSLLLSSWHSQAPGLPPLSLMDRIIEDINYHGYINDGTDEGLERWENVMELRRLASEFTETGLEMFLERVALVSDQDTVDTNANVPTLLTLHAAKGLEFPVVFIVGLDDGTLPHQRAIEDDEELMEERRLFYVGITRAQDRLFLVYPQHRSSYGYAEPVEPSRFLRDITQEFLHEEGVVRNTVGKKSTFRPDRWDSSTSTRTQRVIQQQYSPGMRVIHPVWGEGMVLNSRLQDDDEIVDIYFEQMGLKRVAASLAKLTVKDK